jgi:hypothetical protein
MVFSITEPNDTRYPMKSWNSITVEIFGLFLFKTESRETPLPSIREYIQKLPDWPPGARTANGKVISH